MDAHNRAGYGGLSAEQVQALALGGLVEIGAHTVTHPALPALSADGQRNEVGASRARLEEILGASVTSFAYPYGALTTESAAIVRDAGFDCACATVSGLVEHGSDRFELPRVQVCDWGAEEFGRRLET